MGYVSVALAKYSSGTHLKELSSTLRQMFLPLPQALNGFRFTLLNSFPYGNCDPVHRCTTLIQLDMKRTYDHHE